MTLKDAYREVLRIAIPSTLPTFVVASFGRSGSSLLAKTIAEAVAKARFGTSAHFVRKICEGTVWTLSSATMHPGVVYKTHDYPDGLSGRRNIKALFIFGSALEAARSVLELEQASNDSAWTAEHALHLQRPGTTTAALLEHDALGFLDQARSWTTYTDVPVLCLRYEALWEHVDELRRFCGLPISLPERRSRSVKHLAPEIEDALKHVFDPIDAELAQLPDLIVPAGADSNSSG